MIQRFSLTCICMFFLFLAVNRKTSSQSELVTLTFFFGQVGGLRAYTLEAPVEVRYTVFVILT